MSVSFHFGPHWASPLSDIRYIFHVTIFLRLNVRVKLQHYYLLLVQFHM